MSNNGNTLESNSQTGVTFTVTSLTRRGRARRNPNRGNGGYDRATRSAGGEISRIRENTRPGTEAFGSSDGPQKKRKIGGE